MRQSPLVEALYCIRCGACLNACPIFREIGGHAYQAVDGRITPYPGPIGSIVSPGLFGVPEFGHLARASTLCGACKEACPVDIDLPKLLLRVRAAGADLQSYQKASDPSTGDRPGAQHPVKLRSHVPLGMRLGLRGYTWFAASPRLFSLAQRLAGFFSRIISPRSDWLRLPAFTGWGYSKDFPRPASRPFHARFADLAAAPAQPVQPAQHAANQRRKRGRDATCATIRACHGNEIRSRGPPGRSLLPGAERFGRRSQPVHER